MIKAAIPIETNGRQDDVELAHQQRIDKGQHRINRIRRRSSVAVLELEAADRVRLGPQGLAKAAEIDRRAIAFDTEQLGQAVGFRHGTGTPLKAREKRVGRLYAPPVAAQKSASVAQLRGEGPEALIDRTDTPSFGRKEPAVAPAE